MHTFDVIRNGLNGIEYAGENAARPNGAYDEAFYNVSGLSEDQLRELIMSSEAYSSWRPFEADWRTGIYGSLGYVSAVSLVQHGERSVALFSKDDDFDPSNPVEQAIRNRSQVNVSAAALAIGKAFRGFAYSLRPENMRHMNPMQWATEVRGEPFTLGWTLTDHQILIGACGFSLSPRLLEAIGMNGDPVSANIFGDASVPTPLMGSGLADQLFVNRVETALSAYKFAFELVAGGANLNYSY